MSDVKNYATAMTTDPETGKPMPKVTLSGSNLEYYGATVNERPLPTDVPVGAVYCAVQTQEFWQSDGTSWVVV